jgi:uncharacterized RDD family membrane protein YckC
VKVISPQQNLRKGSRRLTGTRTFLDNAAEMKIYITRDGQRTGPYSLEEVNRQLAAGTLSPVDQAWSEGSPGWKPLLSFPGVIMPGGASSTAMPLGMATPVSAGAINYAGFWIRAVAYIIDVVILGMVLWIIALLFQRSPEEGGGTSAIGAILQIVLGFLYMPVLWSSPMQATIGQKICGLRLIRPGGNRISFARGIARVLAMILSGMLLCIGYLMVAFTERKQGLHDMIAGTYVVKDR